MERAKTLIKYRAAGEQSEEAADRAANAAEVAAYIQGMLSSMENLTEGHSELAVLRLMLAMARQQASDDSASL